MDQHRLFLRDACMQTYEITNFRVAVMNHRILKGFQEILLKLEMRQFRLFQEAHSKLTEGVQRKETYVRIMVTADLRSFRQLKWD